MLLPSVDVLSYNCFFFQAEDGIRDLVRSRGLGDVYKRQEHRRRERLETQRGDGVDGEIREAHEDRRLPEERLSLIHI